MFLQDLLQKEEKRLFFFQFRCMGKDGIVQITDGLCNVTLIHHIAGKMQDKIPPRNFFDCSLHHVHINIHSTVI